MHTCSSTPVLRRSITLLLTPLIVGCSSLGDIQGTPQILRTYDSTCKVLTGHSCGQARQLPYHLKHGQTPQKASEILELLR